jgi:hypothetical protein
MGRSQTGAAEHALDALTYPRGERPVMPHKAGNTAKNGRVYANRRKRLYAERRGAGECVSWRAAHAVCRVAAEPFILNERLGGEECQTVVHEYTEIPPDRPRVYLSGCLAPEHVEKVVVAVQIEAASDASVGGDARVTCGACIKPFPSACPSPPSPRADEGQENRVGLSSEINRVHESRDLKHLRLTFIPLERRVHIRQEGRGEHEIVLEDDHAAVFSAQLGDAVDDVGGKSHVAFAAYYLYIGKTSIEQHVARRFDERSVRFGARTIRKCHDFAVRRLRIVLQRLQKSAKVFRPFVSENSDWGRARRCIHAGTIRDRAGRRNDGTVARRGRTHALECS